MIIIIILNRVTISIKMQRTKVADIITTTLLSTILPTPIPLLVSSTLMVKEHAPVTTAPLAPHQHPRQHQPLHPLLHQLPAKALLLLPLLLLLLLILLLLLLLLLPLSLLQLFLGKPLKRRKKFDWSI